MELTIKHGGTTDEAAAGGSTTLTLVGSIDLMTRQELSDAALPVLSQGHPLTLDMAEVDFIDSTGIGTLIELARVATSHDTRLVISRRSRRVARVLEVIGLEGAWAPDTQLTDAASGDR